jgi:hypothetical protein
MNESAKGNANEERNHNIVWKLYNIKLVTLDTWQKMNKNENETIGKEREGKPLS